MKYVPSKGPARARIFVCGEAPGPHEESEGTPFCGPSGWLLDGALREAGTLRADCFVGNVIRFRPPGNDVGEFVQHRKKQPQPDWVQFRGLWVAPFVPDHVAKLEAEIRSVKPNVVIALGNLALWALTGEWGITTWRGSEMASTNPPGFKVIPSIHPAAVLREMEWRHILVTDLRRAARESRHPELIVPERELIIRPSFKTVMWEVERCQETAPVVDIETRAGHILCIGFATSNHHAICIPFLREGQPYWTPQEEAEIVLAIRRIKRVVGQNLIYDLQYTTRYWGWFPHIEGDTMVMYHCVFPLGGKEEKQATSRQSSAEAKRLDYLASIFAEHYRYWKGAEQRAGSDEMLWQYNCLDTVYTNEVWENLLTLVESQGMTEQVDFQHLVERTMLRIMFRGVRWDIRLAKEYSRQLARQMQDRLDFLERIFGYPVNPRSPQLRKLFYEVLRVQPVYKRKTERPTLDDAALQKVADREPLVRPIVKAVQEFRSLGTVKATMVDAEPDEDERMRTSYNTAGTETFRFSSSTTAFGRGMNLQNLPREEEEELYPNIRSLVQPDEGFLLMEWDLSQADLCVVAWEADDRALKQMLREGVDVHAENAHELGMSRYDGKRWTHATDYGLMPYMAARKFGITVHQAELRQRRYFEMYPGILLWHKRVWNALEVHHAVWNVFGYRRFYFGRIEPSLLPHALAWVPQSTVAIVINKALVAVDQKLPSVEILLQTHDSFTAQVLARLAKRTIPKISELAHIVLPYPDPLTIPIKCKVSKVSWGEVKEI